MSVWKFPVSRPGYQRSLEHIAPRGTKKRAAIDATVVSLVCAKELPAPSDERWGLAPYPDAYLRRVPGRDLWIWYELNASGGIDLVALTSGE